MQTLNYDFHSFGLKLTAKIQVVIFFQFFLVFFVFASFRLLESAFYIHSVWILHRPTATLMGAAIFALTPLVNFEVPVSERGRG